MVPPWRSSAGDGRGNGTAMQLPFLREKEPLMATRTCVVCGRVFDASHGAQRVCGPECRRERSRFHQQRFKVNVTPGPVRKRCLICGAEFTAGKAESRPRKSKTCSRRCQAALQVQSTMKGYYERRPHLQRRCVECGNPFYAILRPRKRTCSDRCQLHRQRDSDWRHRQKQIASGQTAAADARRRASGYMKRYKRQWRRRRAEERAQMELIMLTAAIGTSSPNLKGDPHGKCD